MLQLNNTPSSGSYHVSWLILVGRQPCLPSGAWEALGVVPGGMDREMLLLPQFQSNLLQSRDGQSPEQRDLGQWLFLQKVLQIKCYSLDDWPLTKMPGDFPIMLLYVRKVSCDRGALIRVIGRKYQFGCVFVFCLF